MHDTAVATSLRVAPPLSLHPFTSLRLGPSQLGDPSAARAFARPYRNVAQRLDAWQQRGFVFRDQHPAVVVHEYTTGGLTVRGLVGAIDLSGRAAPGEPSAVLPHEAVHVAQSRDLGRRMDEMSLNPAPILLVRHGGGRATDRLSGLLAGTPDAEYVDRGGQDHRFWRVTDAVVMADLQSELAPAQALIADGHHRFAAYLDLQDRHPGTGWDRGLVMLVDQDDTPLHLGPIHRLLVGTRLADLAAAVHAGGGALRETSRANALATLDRSTLVAHDGSTWATVTLPVARDDLAVCTLHGTVLPSLGPRLRTSYHHTVQDTLDEVARHPDALALLMPAPEFDVVFLHGREGRLLPEKATSFQPKPHAGSLMRNPLDG